MKLKLTEKRGYSILEASDPISAHEAKMLRAGVEKTFKTKKEPLILDLSGASPAGDAFPVLSSLQLMAVDIAADLFIVYAGTRDARLGKLAQFRTLQEATQLLISGSSLMPIREQILLGLLNRLEAQLGEYEDQVKELRQKYVVQDNLPSENVRMEQLLQAMEKEAAALTAELEGKELPVADPRAAALGAQILDYLSASPLQTAVFLNEPKGGGVKK